MKKKIDFGKQIKLVTVTAENGDTDTFAEIVEYYPTENEIKDIISRIWEIIGNPTKYKDTVFELTNSAIRNHLNSGYILEVLREMEGKAKRKGSRLYGILISASDICCRTGSKKFWEFEFHHLKNKKFEIGTAISEEMALPKILAEKKKTITVLEGLHSGNHKVLGYTSRRK